MLGPCWLFLLRYLGLHGGFWRGEKPSTKGFVVEGFFCAGLWVCGANFDNLGSELCRCWVISWALWGSTEVSGEKNITPTENFSVEVIFRGCVGPMLGQCWANVGPMLGQCWGLSWAHVGSFDGLYGLPWRFLDGKNQPQQESLSVEVHFG